MTNASRNAEREIEECGHNASIYGNVTDGLNKRNNSKKRYETRKEGANFKRKIRKYETIHFLWFRETTRNTFLLMFSHFFQFHETI